MNPSLVAQFQAISAMLSQITRSPEWSEHCEKASIGLTETDDDYAINEATFYTIEDAINFFLASESDTQEGFKNTQMAITQKEFDEESENAATPFIWDLIDS